MILEKGIYTLKELNSTVQIGTIAGNRIKHFLQWQENFTSIYDAALIANDTLNIVEDAIYWEEDEDQGAIFPERGDDPDAIDINNDPE